MCNVDHIINSLDRTHWSITSFQIYENENGAQDMSTERTEVRIVLSGGRKGISNYCSDEVK